MKIIRVTAATVVATLSIGLLAPTASAAEMVSDTVIETNYSDAPGGANAHAPYQDTPLRIWVHNGNSPADTRILAVSNTPKEGSRLRPGTHTVKTTVTYQQAVWRTHRIVWRRDDGSTTTTHVIRYDRNGPITTTTFTNRVHVDAVMTPGEYRKIKNGMKSGRVYRIVDDSGTVIERGQVRGKPYRTHAWKKAGSNDYATVTFIGKRARVKSW